MTLSLLKPALYDADDHDPPHGAHPLARLKGGRCGACGYLFFPAQQHGCERCGAHGDALQAHSLSGRGTLVASATVHLHARPERPVPFVIGTVRLNDGPVVRTLLLTAADAALKPGTPMVAVLVTVPNGQDPAPLDLRFAVAPGADGTNGEGERT